MKKIKILILIIVLLFIQSILGINGFNNSSGIDSDAIIEKLVKLEKAPIQRIEKRQKLLEIEIKALQELRKRVKTLQAILKNLYGFRANFENKEVVTNPPGYISGIANRKAQASLHQIKVIQIAGKLKISSDELKKTLKIKSGKIIIHKKEADFSGGTLKTLNNFLNKEFKKFLTSKIIMVSNDSQILLLESTISGEKGMLQIEDPDNILSSLNLINSNEISKWNAKNKTSEKKKTSTKKKEETNSIIKNKNIKKHFVPVLFNLENMEVIKEGPISISSDQKKMLLSKQSIRKLEIDVSKKINLNTSPNDSLSSPIINIKKQKLKAIVIQSSYKKLTSQKPDNAPDEIITGPQEKINISGIELFSYNLKRKRKKEKAITKIDFGIILHYKTKNNKIKKETISLKDKGELNQISLKGKEKLIAIEFYTNHLSSTFKDIKLVYEIEIEKKDIKNKKSNNQILAQQKKMFPHLIDPAVNALLEIEGIKITRDRNTDIKDIIENVTLNLHKAGADISVEVKKNTEKANNQVREFVKAYNELVGIAMDTSRSAEFLEKGSYKNIQTKKGILGNNSAVRNLISRLKYIIASAYPAYRKPYIRVLSMIGVSTGKVGAKWEDIKKGFLIIDDNLLQETLYNHPRAVKEFFGIDKNGDKRINDGLAYTMERFLRPYGKYTRGILVEQIKTKQEQIKQMNKRVKNIERHVAKYKEKLKSKFGYMEGNVRKKKAIGNYLKNRFNQK